ncbi:hypothetical protein DKZ22_09165 [Limosilactobacillus reuteri]|uniref:Uncharacterized protein n=2 Tax=Limosilactobacillus reuteri TaxID=1598 RepID=A0A855XB12_LIMRT|nr:hypothetical protein DKZ24_04735 [Limosilactobacillus reuteri]PWT40274.1 hypothetical protein DKZ22_09165 [Limosilactobacillus reuteri]PWT53679.1 hypothetical protein DKZ31_07755 [Limosilactobacillus reuteri]PWT58524.1 hypothetical protein DKZ30_07820 [Limosilactobacillus reuteri]PWT63319.1 hypothetical protein DKZ20_07820 [Limosilactobacillus reuteri]
MMNNIDMNLVAQSLNQKLAVANYTAASWEAKATQLEQENSQLKSQLEELKKQNDGKEAE